MKGDFSWLDYRPAENFTGVLEQQGRVRLDRDGLAAEEIARHLRNLIGRDTFGPGRVAVPAEVSDSLRVTAAQTDGASVTVTLEPGRAWIDGIPLVVPEALAAEATYLPPPFQPETTPQSIGPGVRDAVVLEVWEDSLSAFQDPTSLLETALGGVDTTERVKVFHRLRLRRLGDDEDCTTIGPSLQDDPDTIGGLTVTPSPAVAIAGDCPVEAGGGYTGDGHRLFCIEIAPPGPGGPRFTWSRFGGGLVGRGRFDAVAAEITITHNVPMIAAANVEGFHLQALAPDPATGDWTVQFTATASFTDGVLSLSDSGGTWPAAPGETAFFRLWDGIEDLAGFTGTTDLTDGIRLQFDPIVNAGENYRPGDRWLFPARTAGSGFDPAVWPQNALPMAIRYHRAPLAELTWTSAPPDQLAAPDGIEDCRDGFSPLTDPCHCCTIMVGDGRTTHGDTDSIEAALERLPMAGGRICLLPGLHECNAVIRERAAIRIAGCGKHSRVVPRPGARETAIFHVIDSENITLESMDMLSISGIAVLAESTDDDSLRQFTVENTRILACIRAIQVEGGSETMIRHNRIRMLDRRDAGVAIYLTGEDSRIEDNDIGVVPAETTPRPPDRPDDEDNPEDPSDPCADADLIYANFGFLVGFVEFVFGFTLTAIVPPPYRALGGVQVGAGAERIAIIDNRILGGAGNGITLGGSHLASDDGAGNGPRFQDVTLNRTVLAIQATVVDPDGNPADSVTIRMTAPSGAATTDVTDASGRVEFAGTGEQGAHRFESVDPAFGIQTAVITDTIQFGAGSLVIMRIELNRQRAQPDPALGFLYAIRIEDNEITAMGLNGIGAPPSPAVLGVPETPTDGDDGRVTIEPRFTVARAAAVNPLLARLGQPVIDLTILNNRITGNLRTPFNTAMRDEARSRGFGGISLGICETVTIIGNRIEANGRRFVDPVCGIFVLFGEQVEVTDNLIRDNGPFVDVDADIERGQRGGIVGIFLAAGLDSIGQDQPAAAAKPALRVHDNIVQQPMGRALTVLGAGPISIVANHLTAERTADEALDRMAGAVLVYNLAGVASLPDGGCLVNSNQVTLGPSSSAFIAMALASAQDIGFGGNQVDAMQLGLVSPNFVAMLNTLIFAATARATDNRFKERDVNVEIELQVSLLSMTTQMNIATSNQGDHCIFAFDQSTPPRLVNAQNLVLDTTFCDEVASAAAGAARNPVLGTVGLSSVDFVLTTGAPTGNAVSYASGLDSNLSTLSSFQQSQLAEAAEIKASTRALLANEVVRLGTRSSTRVDLSQAVTQRLDSSIRDSARFRAAADAVAVKPEAPPDEGGLLLQGRVVDANARGAAQSEVQLTDSDGNALTGVRPVRTDANGGYAFRLTEAQVRRNADAIDAGLIVAVSPQEEREEPVTTDRIVIDGRSTIVSDIRLNRSFAQPTVTRPTRPGGRVIEQPVTRPILTPTDRLTTIMGRISPLLRNSRPTRRRDR